MKKSIAVVLLFFPLFMQGQNGKAGLFSVAVFNNATLLPPASISATFNQPIHIGVTLSDEFGWKQAGRHKWFQNAGLSYFYHRYVYQALLLNTQAGYRWMVKGFSMEGYLQAGYMHAFYLTDRSAMQDDGTYSSGMGFGKPQFIAGAGIGLGYDFGKDEQIRRIFVNYDFRLQMPFVSGYVPMLPNGSLGLGFQFNIN